MRNSWALPDVVLPENGEVLSAEQWVFWFRTLTTASQINIAEMVLDLQREGYYPPTPAAGSVGTSVDLAAVLDGLRGALIDVKAVALPKKQVALLTERIIALGRWISEAK